MSTVRHSGFDNIKGILIFCVVFGHFLELCPADPLTDRLYLVVYSFHMPAFVFLSGYFAKHSHRRIWQLAFLYGAFQLLYNLFAHFVLGSSYALAPDRLLLTPYWLLWYLPVMLYCQFLLPLWIRLNSRKKAVFLGFSICVSLLCGYCPQVGYQLSLSRFLVFLPYFLAGNFAGTRKTQITQQHLALPAVLTLMLSLYLCQSGQFSAPMLYGSYSYAIGYHPGIRLQSMGIAAVWIWFFIVLSNTVLKNPVPFLSYIGAHTLPIYLLHGFVVKCVGQMIPALTVTETLLGCTLTTVLLGNPIIVRLFDRALRLFRKN